MLLCCLPKLLVKIDEECSPCLYNYNGIMLVNMCALAHIKYRSTLRGYFFSVVSIQRGWFYPNYIFFSVGK